MRSQIETFSRVLTHLTPPVWRHQPFRFFGVLGWLAALAMAASLGSKAGLSPRDLAGLALTAGLTFYIVAAATKFLIGRERLVYYHHEIAVLLASAFFSKLAGLPVRGTLDVAALSLGAFLVLGRLGCLQAGCCHGRPSRHGIAYHPAVAEARARGHLIGVRLFPVPILEALAVALITIIGVFLFIFARPGAAFAWYALAYAWLRYGLEFLRGDLRPYWGRMSEAQWTSLLLAVLAAAAGSLGVAGWIGAGALVVAAFVLRKGPREILAAAHVEQLGRLMEAARERAQREGEVFVGETTLGIRVTVSVVTRGAVRADVFSFSGCNREITERTARELASLSALLRRFEGPADLIPGGDRVYHLVLPAGGNVHAV